MDSPGAKHGKVDKETTEQCRGQPWTGETRGIGEDREQQRPLKKQGQEKAEFTEDRERERAGAVTIVF